MPGSGRAFPRTAMDCHHRPDDMLNEIIADQRHDIIVLRGQVASLQERVRRMADVLARCHDALDSSDPLVDEIAAVINTR